MTDTASAITGGTERIASATILDALGVAQDKEARQKAGKRISADPRPGRGASPVRLCPFEDKPGRRRRAADQDLTWQDVRPWFAERWQMPPVNVPQRFRRCREGRLNVGNH
jgi:hypothetical protein